MKIYYRGYMIEGKSDVDWYIGKLLFHSLIHAKKYIDIERFFITGFSHLSMRKPS